MYPRSGEEPAAAQFERSRNPPPCSRDADHLLSLASQPEEITDGVRYGRIDQIDRHPMCSFSQSEIRGNIKTVVFV
jgi:hypothetical protein